MTSAPQPPDRDSSNATGRPGRSVVVGVVVAVLGLVATIVGILLMFAPSDYAATIISVAILAFVILVLVCLWYIDRSPFEAFFQRAEELLRKWNHWLVLIGLSLSASTFILALAIYRAVPIRKDLCEVPPLGSSADIFNSCTGQRDGPCYIEALAPEKTEGIAAFKILVDHSAPPTNKKGEVHSSGWYMTLYGSPCDRLEYRSFRFSWRASCEGSEPDIGVRLVVDDERNPKEHTELVVYEKQNVRALSTKEGDWFSTTIDTRDFNPKKPPPPGVNDRQINKVVFFVNPDTANLCGRGTFWFRDVRFVRNER